MDQQTERRTKSGTITLVEAFRRLLRALYPQRPALADEIISIRWFHTPTWNGMPEEEHNGVPEEEHKAACAALEKLNAERQAGRIHLQGSLDGAPPANIPPIDAAAPRASLDPAAVAGFSDFADFKVFDGTLEIHRKGIPQRTYRQVHALADDVDAIVREIAGESTVDQGDSITLDEAADAAHIAMEDLVAVTEARERPVRDLAFAVVRELWPAGVPSRAEVSDAQIVQRVQNRLKRQRAKEQDLRHISNSSILRAAGRKK
jgi:hypothetical protein